MAQSNTHDTSSLARRSIEERQSLETALVQKDDAGNTMLAIPPQLAEQYLVFAPAAVLMQGESHFRPAFTVIHLDKDEDFYPIEKDRSGSPKKFAMSKNGILKIANAAGIDFSEDIGGLETGEALPVTLKVSNHSPHPVQFPAFGDGDASISLRISATDRSSSMGMFYPADQLPGGTNRTPGTSSSWPHWKSIPCIQLPPGETYELPLDLGKAYQFSGAGGYEVQFSTTIPLLIGDPDGEFADFCPVCLRVRSAAVFNVQ